MLLGKQKKELDRLKEQMAADDVDAIIDGNMKQMFRYGYLPEVWAGIEHFVPSGTPVFVE